jgi:hypothetical protein
LSIIDSRRQKCSKIGEGVIEPSNELVLGDRALGSAIAYNIGVDLKNDGLAMTDFTEKRVSYSCTERRDVNHIGHVGIAAGLSKRLDILGLG